MEIQNLQNLKLGNAMLFEIELKNGKKSIMTTMYNHADVDFEELVLHTKIAMKKSNKIKSVKTTVGSIKSGKFEGLFFYGVCELTENMFNI